jgi:competence protein ComEC
MRLAILGFLAGVIWLQQQANLPPLWWTALPFMVLAVVWLFRHAQTQTVHLIRQVAVVLACAALGVAWAAWRADLRLSEELPREWEGRDIDVVGAIASLPQANEQGLRFEFDVENVLTAGAMLPSHLSIGWYNEINRKTQETTPPPQVVPGERWRLTLRLRRPHGTMNPHGFDFEAWALERNIRATGYVRIKGVNERQATGAPGFLYAVDRWRMRIRDRMLEALANQPYRGVLVALAVGQQNAIPPEQWRVFWRTGTGHLMSISGLHITMVASLMYWLAFRAWARVPALALRLPAQRAAALVGALTALGYALIAGFSVPTQRTFFMLAAVAVALWFGRGVSGTRILAWAMLAVLLLDPWAVLSPGFWLSFGAVAMIFFVTARRTGVPGALSAAARTQVAVTLGLLPMTLALFQEVSLVSPLANAFAIPLISLVVVPITLFGAALGLVVPADLVLALAHAVMHACYLALEWLARLPAAVWQSHAPPLWAAGLALLGMLCLLLPRGLPGRWAGAAMVMPMFLLVPAGPAEGELRVHVLDVGQGLATVVRTARHSLVYDTGPRWNPDADSGSRIVVPFLRGEGIRELDALIVTHDDDDHAGGARSIIAARNPKWLLTSLDADRDAIDGAQEVMRCEAGDAWRWDGVLFEILHPSPEGYVAGAKTNSLGCVLKITARGGSILLTADIEKRSERELLERARDDLKSDVMLVPHHGSRTSSTDEFLDVVAPRTALIAVGYRNRFRHPNAQVMARYAERNIGVVRTDMAGALTVTFRDGTSPEIESFRNVQKRYWLDAPAGGEDPADSR